MRLLLLILALTAVTVPLAAGAPGERQRDRKLPNVSGSPDLWATINVCDTEKHPNVIGIRGAMPGLGQRSAVYMRFQVHYMAASDGKWHNIDENADSGFVKLGVARNRVIESGHNFTFLPPPDGGAHMLRGAVTFVWKIRGRTVKRIREVTEAGHRSTAGADPPGFSAAVCQLS